MTGLWLVSYVILWLVVLGGGAVILILAREIETLHTRLEALERRKPRAEGLSSEVPSATKEVLAGH